MNRNHLTAALSSAALAPLALALAASPAQAATTVSTATTTPLLTASAGDVTVASAGTITVSSGTAVTVNSANAVTINSGGTLAVGSADNATGIAVSPGVASTVGNDGTITVLETYSATDTNSNGIAAVPIALATGRAGILIGAGASGSVENSGTITIDGLNSYGINLAGTYTGNLTNTGTIYVKGDNSVGIATQAVTGAIDIGGGVTVVGQGAQAVTIGGDVNGSFQISGAVSQASSYTTDASATQTLSRSALGVGAAAVEIGGNVTGGIKVYAYCSPTTVGGVASCTSTGTDTTSGSIAGVGNGAALLIGGATNTTIGATTSNDGNSYSLVVDGAISANSVYSRSDAYGVVIGGQGGNVTLTNGIGVTGSISATTADSAATALLINAGSTVTSLTNSGTISATISSPGVGESYAIRDLSGTLTSIVNHGAITVNGTSEDTTAAIDLSHNTSGVTVTQSLTAYEQAEQAAEQAAAGYSASSAIDYAKITGDILTGSGNDTIAINTGLVTGSAYTGAGDDTIQIGNDAEWNGDLHLGTGTGTITVSGTAQYTGGLYLEDQPVSLALSGTATALLSATSGTSQLGVTVGSGATFGASKVVNLTVGTLNVASGGTFKAYIDGSTGTSSLVSATSATFASGSKISASISSLESAAGTYHVLSAATLSGSPTFDSASTELPVLFSGSVSNTGNDLYLTITRKTAADLGLTRAQGAAYDAIYNAAVADTALGTSLLEVTDVAGLQAQMDGLLPDHAGAVFDFVTRSSRLTTRHLTDDSSLYDFSDVGAWLEPVMFGAAKAATGTMGWSSHGFGLSGGLERKTGIGYIGFSGSWVSGTIHDGSTDDIKANNYELAGFWRLSKGPFYAFAKVAADRISLSSVRTFTGAISSTAFTYTADGKWAGWAVSGTAGASYKLQMPGNFSLKPMATFDAYRLSEHGYNEAGTAAMILGVAGRTSSVTTATTTLTAAWSAGRATRDDRPLTIEVEAGRRSVLSGNLGTTTASFLTTGDQFSITPDAIKGGWVGEARVLLGGFDYTWQLSAGAEQTQGKTDYTARASLSIAL
ncbi:autotransporter domain-containing protein [Novosphingobium flavum]|uniref:Autotransporter domain-containing protein n=1 Tax=Novosphingobium flavum TaxID=1778672 RepID=A0A7X1FW28_9SPHN|nr:autotransporter domain-containing protein [Novosphingobium flavum]MBC2667442.1 autotransporter domain-containing protein [Novosphingobium flavum]